MSRIEDVTNEILARLKKIASDSLGITPTTDFILEALIDSFSALTLIMELENRYTIKFQPRDLARDQARTAKGLAELVVSKELSDA